MYRKVLTKPKEWDEESLALASKEELAADLVLRKSRLQSYKHSLKPWNILAVKKEKYWIHVVGKELKQRMEWIID